MTKKIMFLTGTRADFGKMKKIIETITDDYDVMVAITGMHMDEKFGLTICEVKQTKNVSFVEFPTFDVVPTHADAYLKLTDGLIRYFQKYTPNLVVIHGDRLEALATATVCLMLGIRVAHIEGGEVSGTIDESFRHAITKMAYAHFVSSEQARDRILKMGEEHGRIFVIGSPEFDVHKNVEAHVFDQALKRYEIPFDDYAIFSYHPVFYETNSLSKEIKQICNQLQQTKKNYIVIRPNNEMGNKQIVSAFDKLPTNNIKMFPSLRFEFFSQLMRNAKLFIGNSSAGVREAPFFGVQTIDIGTRQNNRSTAQSIQHIGMNELDNLATIIDKLWGKTHDHDLTLGDGNSSQQFKKILKSNEFWELPLQKTYQDYEGT